MSFDFLTFDLQITVSMETGVVLVPTSQLNNATIPTQSINVVRHALIKEGQIYQVILRKLFKCIVYIIYIRAGDHMTFVNGHSVSQLMAEPMI